MIMKWLEVHYFLLKKKELENGNGLYSVPSQNLNWNDIYLLLKLLIIRFHGRVVYLILRLMIVSSQ